MSRTIDKRNANDYLQNEEHMVVGGRGLAEAPEPLGAAPATNQDYTQQALAYLQSGGGGGDRAAALGPNQAVEYSADPVVHTTSSGATVVHAQQQYKGLDIVQSAQTVRFDPDGQLRGSHGASVTVAADLPVNPRLSAADAVLAAAQFVATPGEDEAPETDQFGEAMVPVSVNISGFKPQLISAFKDMPSQPSVFSGGPFDGAINTRLVLFPIDASLTVAYEVVITLPQMAGKYRVLVSAADGEILYSANLLNTLNIRGSIYTRDPGQSAQVVAFPRALGDLPVQPVPPPLPNGFPDAWTSGNTLAGNCSVVALGSGDLGYSASVRRNNVLFQPGDPLATEQQQVNLFYLTCLAHDIFYLLGFREADGNFQQDDFGRGGMGGDRLTAWVYDGPVYGTANMSTPPDGAGPTMQMGLVSATGRHTALDSSVVLHEYTHGVTNRLVGGAHNTQALEAPQSAGMGEGWGDYIACTINQTDVVGAWVLDNATGIRSQPYSNYPVGLGFGVLGQGNYGKVHYIGEVWCATLLRMNELIGATLGLQLVVDALKLAPANPSFIDMRQSILLALYYKGQANHMSTAEYQDAYNGIWTAFAEYGMGPGASSRGATLLDIRADTTNPTAHAAQQPQVPATADHNGYHDSADHNGYQDSDVATQDGTTIQMSQPNGHYSLNIPTVDGQSNTFSITFTIGDQVKASVAVSVAGAQNGTE